jgi:multiple sugar transport system ATP-binding protein
MANVEICALRKSYGSVEVLHGVDITVDDGEFMVLVGPSGCGKSTLLRMIAGLEETTDGAISIGGRIVNDVSPKERDIAMVFQNYALYPHMTVRKNIAFSLKLRGMDNAEIDRRVKNAATILDLESYLGRLPRQLSGGQRQRVAMGRAISRDPQVFLFDEPLSNLDAQLRVQMRAEIRALHRRLRTTSIYVTHDQIEAMTMADRMAILRAGRVEQIGTPLELYDRPSNMFVAGFIGSPAMNFIPGIVRRNGGVAYVDAGPALHLPLAAESPGVDGQPVIYGIRPEHLDVGPEAQESTIEAQVETVETTGASTLVVGKVQGVSIGVHVNQRHNATPGEPIFLRPCLGAVYIFDAESGMSLRN